MSNSRQTKRRPSKRRRPERVWGPALAGAGLRVLAELLIRMIW
ncbi:hypothetical protein [Micromonospora chersina]